LLSGHVARAIEADESIASVKIMSALSNPAVRGIPRKSYGIDPASGALVEPWHPAGVIAAQSIGEPGTQLSLDSKHRSGAVLADETAQGLHRVDELFEVRTPKGQAYITEISGEVSVREEGEQYIVQISGKEEEEVVLKLGERTATIADGQEVVVGDVVATLEGGESPLVAPITGAAQVLEDKVVITPTTQTVVRYEIPGFKQLVVKNGDFVVAGDRLTSGSINLHDLMNLKGVVETQRYILNQISKIFAAQGQNISDKHLEIVIRQMFSRVSIEEPGDTDFVTGDIVSKAAVLEANQKLSQEGKKPAEFNQLLLGITKVSTWADSFLSAASFQDTTRVLIAAATSGKVDHLYGLKENVILGRKIPVGTGYTPKVSVDEEE
jgi:DNA-directed RNA polymerase subunit beta'